MSHLIETVYNLLWGDLFTLPVGGGIGISLMAVLLLTAGVGDGGEQPFHQQKCLFRGGGPPLADELAGVGDECAGQAVLRRCRVRAFAADTGLTGTGSAVRRLLALKTKHLFVHFRTLSSLDVVSMDGLAGLYTGRTRGVFSASIRGGAPLAGRAWNVR